MYRGIRKRMCRVYYREKKIDCTDYREVDIIPRTEAGDIATRGSRGKREKVQKPKQCALNDKNAKRYLVQLGNGNFGIGDLHVSCTYSKEHLPGTVEEAESIVRNYLRRLDYRRKKLGIEPLKYILVTEYKYSKDGKVLKRIHHHIIMDGQMDRNIVEDMWTSQRINWKKYENDKRYAGTIDKLGWINADRLQVNENGIEGLCKYIVKDPQGKKRYSSSRNLERPEVTRSDQTEKESRTRSEWRASRGLKAPTEKCNDFKFSRKRIIQLATSPDGGLEVFRKIYKDYDIVSCEPVYYEQTGWHIYLKMWRKKRKEDKKSAKTTPKKKRKSKGSGSSDRDSGSSNSNLRNSSSADKKNRGRKGTKGS